MWHQSLVFVTVSDEAPGEDVTVFSRGDGPVRCHIRVIPLVLGGNREDAGSLADRYGRRRLFAIGLAVFTGGSLACGLAGGIVFLVLARAG